MAGYAFSITPHDTNPLPRIPQRIYVGGTGDINLQGFKDTANTVLKAVPAGAVLEISPKFIWATDTTATFLVGIS